MARSSRPTGGRAAGGTGASGRSELCCPLTPGSDHSYSGNGGRWLGTTSDAATVVQTQDSRRTAVNAREQRDRAGWTILRRARMIGGERRYVGKSARLEQSGRSGPLKKKRTIGPARTGSTPTLAPAPPPAAAAFWLELFFSWPARQPITHATPRAQATRARPLTPLLLEIPSALLPDLHLRLHSTIIALRLHAVGGQRGYRSRGRAHHGWP